MTKSLPARVNRDGRPCPPWCVTDHSDPLAAACIGGGGGIDHLWTRAARASLGGARVTVTGTLPDPAADWPQLILDLRDAEHLAVIIALLADATPDQHRELAAQIRQAAAQITDGGQP